VEESDLTKLKVSLTSVTEELNFDSNSIKEVFLVVSESIMKRQEQLE